MNDLVIRLHFGEELLLPDEATLISTKVAQKGQQPRETYIQQARCKLNHCSQPQTLQEYDLTF